MNAAETSASSAIADWTPLAVASRSRTTAEMETFISDVSTTRTNIAIASRSASRWSPFDSSGIAAVASALMSAQHLAWCAVSASSWVDDVLAVSVNYEHVAGGRANEPAAERAGHQPPLAASAHHEHVRVGRVGGCEDLRRRIAGRLERLARQPAARESRLGFAENPGLTLSLVVAHGLQSRADRLNRDDVDHADASPMPDQLGRVLQRPLSGGRRVIGEEDPAHGRW